MLCSCVELVAPTLQPAPHVPQLLHHVLYQVRPMFVFLHVLPQPQRIQFVEHITTKTWTGLMTYLILNCVLLHVLPESQRS